MGKIHHCRFCSQIDDVNHFLPTHSSQGSRFGWTGVEMSWFRRGNRVLDINPPPGDARITPVGRNIFFWLHSLFLFIIRGDSSFNNFLNHGSSSSPVTKVYFITFLWVYLIAWGLCEAGNVISSDGEALFYGVLDCLAKVVFGFRYYLDTRVLDLTNWDRVNREGRRLEGRTICNWITELSYATEGNRDGRRRETVKQQWMLTNRLNFNIWLLHRI